LTTQGKTRYQAPIENGIPNSVLQPLANAESLIDRTYQQLLEAIAEGTLAPGQRIRQAELADTLGISRQPVSHALHLLKRQGLVEDYGKKGLRVVPLDTARVSDLYQVREAIDAPAARLAARRVAAGCADMAILRELQAMVRAGQGFSAVTPMPVLVRADADFHRALYRLSGNQALTEMTEPMWPHLMRSMASVLVLPDYANLVWQDQHPAILDAIITGDAARSAAAAEAHAASAARLTAERLQPKAA